jgi:hypothetical protein
MQANPNFDSRSFLGPLGPILSLDSHGIYGSNIWVFFKNCCRHKIFGMITVLRAVQLGLFSETELWNHIDSSTPIDVKSLYEKVKSELDGNFGGDTFDVYDSIPATN